MPINLNEVAARKLVWQAATELVVPIIEDHGLLEIKTVHSMVNSVTTTAVEQNIDHIMRVADWLMEKE
jgi:hypothetical protein